jgi:sirohydrochlorin cobaltochelatase
MPNSIERALAAALTDPCYFGQILIRKAGENGFVLCHRDDQGLDGLLPFQDPEDAIEISKFDHAGNYRPLKTAPNLDRGWQLAVVGLSELRRALDYFYPGRLAALVAWKENRLKTTPLRQTLDRQSGMYRIAAEISDEQINGVVGDFCKSDGGCLRTILWKRNEKGIISSTKLPPEKFEPTHDQALGPRSATATTAVIPLLCQEACNLLVAAARKAVKGE